jgi:hypothetical protein
MSTARCRTLSCRSSTVTVSAASAGARSSSLVQTIDRARARRVGRCLEMRNRSKDNDDRGDNTEAYAGPNSQSGLAQSARVAPSRHSRHIRANIYMTPSSSDMIALSVLAIATRARRLRRVTHTKSFSFSRTLLLTRHYISNAVHHFGYSGHPCETKSYPRQCNLQWTHGPYFRVLLESRKHP